MPELLQGFLIGVVLALAAGALVLYLRRVHAGPADDPTRPPRDGSGTDRTDPEERRG